MCRYDPYMTKALRKAIMKRSEFETNKNRRTCAVNYMKYKEFWKTVKPFLFDKVGTFPEI